MTGYWHITRNRGEAEDIVQDVMIKVWNMEEGSKQIESMEAYCYTMTKNMALNRLELKINQNVEFTTEKEQITEEEPQRLVEQTERMRMLYSLMEQLPLPQRDIMLLRDVEGMSYSGIAVTLQLTEEQEEVWMYIRETKGYIAELVILIGSKSEFVLMNFMGKIDLKKIAKLTKSVNVDGIRYLDKVKDSSGNKVNK